MGKFSQRLGTLGRHTYNQANVYEPGWGRQLSLCSEQQYPSHASLALFSRSLSHSDIYVELPALLEAGGVRNMGAQFPTKTQLSVLVTDVEKMGRSARGWAPFPLPLLWPVISTGKC